MNMSNKEINHIESKTHKEKHTRIAFQKYNYRVNICFGQYNQETDQFHKMSSELVAYHDHTWSEECPRKC